MKTALTALTFFAIFLAACSGSKSFSKKAAKLDESGMYAEAADMYLQSAVRNAKNIDAKIGLKKTGQTLMNDKLSTFFKAFSLGTDKESAGTFWAASGMMKKSKAKMTDNILMTVVFKHRQVRKKPVL